LIGQGKANIREWHLVVFPLLVMFVTLQLVVFIGEAVREAFDPKVFSRLR
jgi:microcin C transport system permease protein